MRCQPIKSFNYYTKQYIPTTKPDKKSTANLDLFKKYNKPAQK